MSPKFKFLILFAAALGCSSLSYAQVSAASSRPLILSGYATASGAKPELGKGHALGGSGGIILEHSHFLALDARGVMLKAREPIHTYAAEMGPRVTQTFWRLRPYGEVLAGLGHSGYLIKPGKKPLSNAYGFIYTVDFGVDLRLKYHIEWRVAEYSYSHIAAGTGASPTILNTGIVYRF